MAAWYMMKRLSAFGLEHPRAFQGRYHGTSSIGIHICHISKRGVREASDRDKVCRNHSTFIELKAQLSQ